MAPYRNYKGNSINSTAASTSSKEELLEKYLKDFRVDQCPLFLQHKCQQHRPFTCFHWHFQNQKRRRPIRKRDGTFNYSADTYCSKYDETTGICPDGDECTYLHRTAGDTERRYHLKYYKTGMCVHDTDNRGFCVKNGPHCAFAHGTNDLRQPIYDIRELQAIENGECDMVIGPNSLDKERSLLNDDPKWLDTTFVLANYKTEPCKKPPRLCRQGYACPQFHNNKDKRRSPKKFKYRSTPCPNVKSGDEWGDPVACDSGENCQYCHTRTEQQFHPEIYKSTKCNDIQNTSYCPRGAFCAFAHIEQETVSLETSPSSPDHCKQSIGEILQHVLPNGDCDSSKNQELRTEIVDMKGIPYPSRTSASVALRNGSLTPPFEENGVASPIDRPPVSMEPKKSSLSTSIDSALVSSPNSSAFQNKNRFLSGDTNRESLIRRGMFSIDNAGDPSFNQGHKMASFTTAASTNTNNTFSHSNGLFPSLGESLDSVGNTLEDLNLDSFDCGSKSRKSSGFSDKMYDGKSRNLSGNSLSASITGIFTNGSAPVMIPGNQGNISPAGISPPHKNFLLNGIGGETPIPLPPAETTSLLNGPRNSLGLFDLNSDRESELKRLKEELAQARQKLSVWEEGIYQARNACEAWKKETSLATKKADHAFKEKESALAKMDQLQKEMDQMSGGSQYLHALTRVSELRALPLGVLRSLEWNLRKDLKEVENVILKQSENNQWNNNFSTATSMQHDWSLNMMPNQHSMFGPSMTAQQ